MKVQTREIGPSEAQELLCHNSRNRNLRPNHISKLAHDMRNEAWRDGGAILFAGTGEDRVLIDGQHRLHAVIAADVKVNFIIVEGLDLADQQAVDTGLRRSLADVLKWQGEANCTDLAAALSWLWRRSNGAMRSNYTPTVAQALAALEEHPGLRECFKPTRPAARILSLPRGLCACLYYEQLSIDADDAMAFWDMLATGLVPESNERHPVHILRRQLEENGKKAIRKLDAVSVAAMLIKGWNAYRDGREVTLLMWRRGGAKPEPFPELT